jgi:CRISPR/Cas system-associated exonuclease Cas4 (RecB family)
MQYYFQYVEELKLPSTASQITGKEYHSALEINHLQKIDTAEDLPLNELDDFYANKVEESFKEDVLLKESEKEKGKIAVRDTPISRGQAALKVYHSDLAPGLQPLEVERRFTVPLGKNLPPLVGILDLVTIAMKVVDHKFSAKAPKAEEANSSIQLSAYALGFYELYGYLPDELELQYSVVSEKSNSKTVVLKTTRTMDQVDRFMNRVRLVVDGIRKGVFIPPDSTSWACGYCGYRDAGYCKL